VTPERFLMSTRPVEPAEWNTMPEHAPAALAAATTPWAFTQEHPFTTAEFCKEAGKRNIRIEEAQLRELWRVGALAPFVEVRSRRAHDPWTTPIPEPLSAGTWQSEFRRARDAGRLVDAVELGFRPQLRFTRPAARSYQSGWWNGLLYSRWQLIGLHEVRGLLDQGTWERRGGSRTWRCRQLDEWALDRVARSRELAALLVAIEARYLPRVEQGWLHLINASPEEWDTFVQNFHVTDVLTQLGWDSDRLLKSADDLLLGLHWIDPLPREWSELLRRAPHRAWRDLSGDLLVALDRRIAAEVLLLCYDDLRAPPLSERRDVFHFESDRERLSYRAGSLDANLSALGISPHPGVVLVVEGETEEIIVPRVRDHIRIPDEAEVLRSVVLRGVKGDLTKLAAFASAPLIEGRQGNDWLLVKPPTYLLVAVDPDPPFDTEGNVEVQRRKIIDEIVAVVRSQGVEPQREDVESLVEITTWSASCFEFEHFTDAELAEALRSIHIDCGGLDRANLEGALSAQRLHRQDIKNVWRNWRTPPSKRILADALWPILERKLDAAAEDSSREVPAIAERLLDAFHRAMQRPRGRFVLRGTAIE
jgi:hypothetical protein